MQLKVKYSLIFLEGFSECARGGGWGTGSGGHWKGGGED